MNTPASPMHIPKSIDRLRKFSDHFGLSRITNHNGAEDIVIETSPLGTLCSTQIIKPFPKNKSRIPLIIACLTFGIPNSFSPFIMHHEVRQIPAIRNLSAPNVKGGNSATAFSIKKYVDPHTMYTIAKAKMTITGEAVLLFEEVIIL